MDALRRLDHVGVALGVSLGAATVLACNAASASAESDLADFVHTGKKVSLCAAPSKMCLLRLHLCTSASRETAGACVGDRRQLPLEYSVRLGPRAGWLAVLHRRTLCFTQPPAPSWAFFVHPFTCSSGSGSRLV